MAQRVRGDYRRYTRGGVNEFLYTRKELLERVLTKFLL